MDGIQNVIRDVAVVKAAVSELATVSKQVLRGLFKARLDDLRTAKNKDNLDAVVAPICEVTQALQQQHQRRLKNKGPSVR